MTQQVNRRAHASMDKKFVLIGCDVCGRKNVLLQQVEGKMACEYCKPLLIEHNMIERIALKMLDVAEACIRKVDSKIAGLPILAHAMEAIVTSACHAICALDEVTRHKVRLYMVEGPQLSTRSWDRITWYSDPVTAREIADQAGWVGRMVYVDVTLSFCSDYSFRFYSAYKQAYTLRGALLKHARRTFKYVKEAI